VIPDIHHTPGGGSPGLKGDLILRHGTDRHEMGRRLAEQASADGPNVWEVMLPVGSRYEVEIVDSDISVVIDPAKAKGDPYVYRLPKP